MAEAEHLAAGGEVMSEDAERPTTPDIYCDPCLQDDEKQHAEGFCVDCNEYLCHSCFKAHRKTKMLKFHQLKSKTEMPVTKPATETEEEKCMEHNRELRFYCKSHDQVFCEICKHADHRTCKNIRTIDSLNGEASSLDKEQWIIELNDIEDQFKANKKILERHRVSVEFYHKQAIRSIRQVADRNKYMLRAIESTCDSVGPGIDALKTDISEPDDKRSLFLLKYRVNNQMNALKQRLKSVTIDNKIARYWCIPSDSAGKVGFVVRCPFEDNKLGVKTDTDRATCTITAIVPLSATKLIIADQDNNKLKVIDKTGNVVSSEINLYNKPWDITMIGENTVAVTTGDGTRTQVRSLPEQMNGPKKTERNYSYFQSSCKGIVFKKDSFVVSHSSQNVSESFPKEKQVQVLDLGGKLKHTLNLRDRNGPVRIGDVEYLAQSRVTSHIYLSDSTYNAILWVTLDGFVNARFRHDLLAGARGITAGRDGRVFVCGYDKYVVFELKSDLSSGEVILEEKDGVNRPLSIFYDDDEHKLYIGCAAKNDLLVFLV